MQKLKSGASDDAQGEQPSSNTKDANDKVKIEQTTDDANAPKGPALMDVDDSGVASCLLEGQFDDPVTAQVEHKVEEVMDDVFFAENADKLAQTLREGCV